MTTPWEQKLLANMGATLSREFAGIFSRETISRCLLDFMRASRPRPR